MQPFDCKYMQLFGCSKYFEMKNSDYFQLATKYVRESCRECTNFMLANLSA